jgi:hypothetical protein
VRANKRLATGALRGRVVPSQRRGIEALKLGTARPRCVGNASSSLRWLSRASGEQKVRIELVAEMRGISGGLPSHTGRGDSPPDGAINLDHNHQGVKDQPISIEGL